MECVITSLWRSVNELQVSTALIKGPQSGGVFDSKSFYGRELVLEVEGTRDGKAYGCLALKMSALDSLRLIFKVR